MAHYACRNCNADLFDLVWVWSALTAAYATLWSCQLDPFSHTHNLVEHPPAMKFDRV